MIKILDESTIVYFDWDRGNIKKSEIKHKVHYKECEEVLLNEPVISEDLEHSIIEKRYSCIGETKSNKILFISFTIRGGKIRVISGRPADRREKNFYEKTKKTAKI